jgi:hypothetical protein
MKKVSVILTATILFAGISFASPLFQTAPAKANSDKKEVKKTDKKTDKKEVKKVPERKTVTKKENKTTK